MNLSEVLQWARAYDASLSLPVIRILLARTLNQSPLFLLKNPSYVLQAENLKTFQGALKKLSEGMPLSRILGEREFWSLLFKLNESTLDPRPDSECLVEAVMHQIPDSTRPLRILDLGTGTGCLLISLLSEYPKAVGIGVDQSAQALDAARANADNLLESPKRASFLESNWFSEVQGTFDVIISNPPYISENEYQVLDKSVKDYDPQAALVGGEDGLQAYQHIIQNARPFLNPEGILVLEIGYQQNESVSVLLKENSFQRVAIQKDLAGIDRCLVSKLCA